MSAFGEKFQPLFRRVSRRATLQPDLPATTPQNPDLPPRLSVVFSDRDPSDQALKRLFDQGLFLARQEAWDEIGILLRGMDACRDHTSDGRSSAVAFAKGVRHDAVTAATQGVGCQDIEATLRALAPLDAVQEELCEDHGIAYIVAMAHIDTAEAWHGAFANRDTPPAKRVAFRTHMQKAARIIAPFDPVERNAPTLAIARCRLLRAVETPSDCVSDRFEDLIDLDPASPMHLRHFGRALLPRQFGTHERLETEARRMAMLTRDVWGTGAYTWMYLDPLSRDLDVLDVINPDLFVEGMHDILKRGHDQRIANQFAVLTGVTLAGGQPHEKKRNRIAQAFGWVVQDHLREVAPLIWAAAPGAPDGLRDQDIASFGRSRAMQVLARHFSDNLMAGQYVTLTDAGFAIAATRPKS